MGIIPRSHEGKLVLYHGSAVYSLVRGVDLASRCDNFGPWGEGCLKCICNGGTTIRPAVNNPVRNKRQYIHRLYKGVFIITSITVYCAILILDIFNHAILKGEEGVRFFAFFDPLLWNASIIFARGYAFPVRKSCPFLSGRFSNFVWKPQWVR